MTTTASEIDLAAKSFWEQPMEERDAAFAVLRRENPIPWSRPAESDLLPPELNTRGFWSLTKYDDIRYASRNPQLFSSAGGITMEDFSPEMTEAAQSFIAMDAPRHTQLRGITMDAFKPGNMKRLESWVQGHARDLIDEMAAKGEGDFVELVSVQLPGRIFGSFFGLPPGEVHDRTIAAAQRLIGHHDFTTFRDSHCQAKSPVKTLDRFDVSRSGETIQLWCEARSFLHRQVRSMVGTLVEVGLGKMSADDVANALAAADRTRCGPVAPSDGLYLARVDYAK